MGIWFVGGAFEDGEGVLRGSRDAVQGIPVAEAAPKPCHSIVKPRKKPFCGIEIARWRPIGKAMNGILFNTVSNKARTQSRTLQHIEDSDRRQEEIALFEGGGRHRLKGQTEGTPILVEIAPHRHEGRKKWKALRSRFHNGLQNGMRGMVHRDETRIGLRGGRDIGKSEVEPPVLGIGFPFQMLAKPNRCGAPRRQDRGWPNAPVLRRCRFGRSMVRV
ncbi:MAG: hypothetical protein KAG89_12700 [Fulvimarina manganoxydans]|uniref:hypothetical protein n=1 Tax=Fulvimarina manganoxydans TaxID=937218 RepID=UPI0023561995|nr:hypothetical protein [Fulvimarina manganoxydans]MCK5933018.1 hypothetical protein [Fulvimarina manganoxydans]